MISLREVLVHSSRSNTRKRPHADREAQCGALGSTQLVVPIIKVTCFPCWVHNYGVADARRHFAARYGEDALVEAVATQPIICDCPNCTREGGR